MHNQKRDNSKFKNKKQPELPDIQTSCKSDNLGVKETFIHTGRRGRDGQLRQRGHIAKAVAGGPVGPTLVGK